MLALSTIVAGLFIIVPAAVLAILAPLLIEDMRRRTSTDDGPDASVLALAFLLAAGLPAGFWAVLS